MSPSEVIREYCKQDSTVDAGNLLWAAKQLEAALKEAVEMAESGLDFIEQCRDQNTMLPGEVDGFEERVRDFLEKHRALIALAGRLNNLHPISEAWCLVEHLSSLHFSLEGKGDTWAASFDSDTDSNIEINVHAEADTPAKAITLAAQRAMKDLAVDIPACTE